jgi:hypothetical protein
MTYNLPDGTVLDISSKRDNIRGKFPEDWFPLLDESR